MRYKISGNAAGQRGVRITAPVATERAPAVVAQWRHAAGVARAVREGRFAPVSWPGTPRDVTWMAAPVFGRSPSGWVRRGFHS